ncbi:MAG: UDP-N-acetylmuramoyl-L-alanine--D-glutamate ligase [Cyclobacteriaceae bacterium]|nr:UDP-N-acetylmuramoyl-L-alanine--D-glutamate ligase [Cyclobacteriaceae bacterium SS2]
MSKRVTILGSGESGLGAAKLASKMGYEVFLSDYGKINRQAQTQLKSFRVDFEEGGHDIPRIMTSDLIVKSPGIPDTVKVVVEALAKGIPVISEVEFAYQHLDDQAKVIAITGTNGKTTTTLLTYHLLKKAGLKVALGGNVGVSFAGLVAKGGFDYYVIEVSSFQLDGIVKFKPDVAVLLNITPDHLDRYENSMQKYISSKFRITENLTKEECFIYCADSKPITEELARRNIEACLFAISATKNDKWHAYLDEEHLIFNYEYKEAKSHHKIPVSEISLIGKHNMINTMASVLCALRMEISIKEILKGLKSFKNAPHRLEKVAEIDGVTFINDSKATNVDSVYYALEGINQPVIWMAGGVDKGNDYTALDDLVKDKVKALISLGVDNKPLNEHYRNTVSVLETDKIKKAVKMAFEHAKPGDVVLLSPACASFDLFKNYEDRGEQFKKAVKSLVKPKKVKS